MYFGCMGDCLVQVAVTAVDKYQALWGRNREIDPKGLLFGTSGPALSLDMLLWSQEQSLGAVNRVPSRENRDVYTEHNYPNSHVIIKRPKAAG